MSRDPRPLTVLEAARHAGRSPETVRRWIRQGRLRARRIGAGYLIDEADLTATLASFEHTVDLPPQWRTTFWNGPMPDVVAAVRRSRSR